MNKFTKYIAVGVMCCALLCTVVSVKAVSSLVPNMRCRSHTAHLPIHILESLLITQQRQKLFQ